MERRLHNLWADHCEPSEKDDAGDEEEGGNDEQEGLTHTPVLSKISFDLNPCAQSSMQWRAPSVIFSTILSDNPMAATATGPKRGGSGHQNDRCTFPPS
jgi:hypothetical protein